MSWVQGSLHLNMPNLTVPAQAPPPAAAATISTTQPLNTLPDIANALPFTPRSTPLDTSNIGDPMTMTVRELNKIRHGHRVDIYTRQLDPNGPPSNWQSVKAEVPAKMLCAFSNVAKRQLNGIKFGETNVWRLEDISPVAILRMVSYLYAACDRDLEQPATPTEGSKKSPTAIAFDKTQSKNKKQPKKKAAKKPDQAAATTSTSNDPKEKIYQMPMIHTRDMSWNEYMFLWKMAEDLEMPLILAKLTSQIRDLSREPLTRIMWLLITAREMKINTPQKHFAGRLKALAQDKNIKLSDVEALFKKEELKDFADKAINTYAHAHFDKVAWNKDSKLTGASDKLKEAILARWAVFHNAQVRRAQEQADRKKEDREHEANALYTWNQERGEMVKYYRTDSSAQW